MALLLTGVNWGQRIMIQGGSPAEVEAAASREPRPRAQIETPPSPGVSSSQRRRRHLAKKNRARWLRQGSTSVKGLRLAISRSSQRFLTTVKRFLGDAFSNKICAAS
ncbi:hypothetical protein ISCGN_012668 [Ixodes scapularis]